MDLAVVNPGIELVREEIKTKESVIKNIMVWHMEKINLVSKIRTKIKFKKHYNLKKSNTYGL